MEVDAEAVQNVGRDYVSTIFVATSEVGSKLSDCSIVTAFFQRNLHPTLAAVPPWRVACEGYFVSDKPCSAGQAIFEVAYPRPGRCRWQMCSGTDEWLRHTKTPLPYLTPPHSPHSPEHLHHHPPLAQQRAVPQDHHRRPLHLSRQRH